MVIKQFILYLHKNEYFCIHFNFLLNNINYILSIKQDRLHIYLFKVSSIELKWTIYNRYIYRYINRIALTIV